MTQNPYNAPVGLAYKNIVNAGTTVVKASPGMLGTVLINGNTGAATLSIFDNVTATGTVSMGILSVGTATVTPLRLELNANAATGISIISTGTLNATILYR